MQSDSWCEGGKEGGRARTNLQHFIGELHSAIGGLESPFARLREDAQEDGVERNNAGHDQDT